MKRIGLGLAVLMGISLISVFVYAENHVFEFSDEVQQGEQRPGFRNKVIVKTATFTVGAVAIKDEVKPHRHQDGAHVVYIVSGGGTMTHGDKKITLKPGMIVHVPPGVAHGIKAEGGELTLVDFAQPPFDPNKIEWIK
ncbi:MAG TPA: cupin domain-containing protein [Nitrospirales bacterium]